MEREKLNSAFEQFMDTDVCREAEWELHDLLRAAFVAGWRAAQDPFDQDNEGKRTFQFSFDSPELS